MHWDLSFTIVLIQNYIKHGCSLEESLSFSHSSPATGSISGKYDPALSADSDKRLKLYEKVTSDGPAPCPQHLC